MAPDPTGSVGARAFIALQHLLPQHAISRLVHALARVRVRWIKDALIAAFMRGFRPDLSDAAQPDPHAFESFNAFFTRALRPGARPIAAGAGDVACPVDGTVSECGPIRGDRLLQAKGHDYSLAALLAGRDELVTQFADGLFATIYLAPYNYHRIHMPLAGTLSACWYVPGDLFSVNTVAAAHVAGLFARNERVVCAFEGGEAPFALVLVGALNVGSMETVWHGEVSPRRPRTVTALPLTSLSAPLALARGDEMARFNMGSTVILLLPRKRASWHTAFVAGAKTRMGEQIGTLTPAHPGAF
jgi:phosphatidylserine decarboxylase